MQNIKINDTVMIHESIKNANGVNYADLREFAGHKAQVIDIGTKYFIIKIDGNPIRRIIESVYITPCDPD